MAGVCEAACGYAAAGHWWAGRDNTALTEPALSQENRLKTRPLSEGVVRCDRRPPQRMSAGDPTIMTLVHFAGGRVTNWVIPAVYTVLLLVRWLSMERMVTSSVSIRVSCCSMRCSQSALRCVAAGGAAA